jgi:hypothetical protein
MESLGASIFLHNTLVGQDYMSVLLQHSANPQREDHAERVRDHPGLMMIVKDEARQTVLSLPFLAGCA